MVIELLQMTNTVASDFKPSDSTVDEKVNFGNIKLVEQPLNNDFPAYNLES